MEMQPHEHERRPSPRTITPLSTPAALGGMGLLRFPYHQDELRNLVRSALDEQSQERRDRLKRMNRNSAQHAPAGQGFR